MRWPFFCPWPPYSLPHHHASITPPQWHNLPFHPAEELKADRLEARRQVGLLLSKLLEADEQEQSLTQQLHELRETIEEKRAFYDSELRQLMAELAISVGDLEQDVNAAHSKLMARGGQREATRACTPARLGCERAACTAREDPALRAASCVVCVSVRFSTVDASLRSAPPQEAAAYSDGKAAEEEARLRELGDLLEVDKKARAAGGKPEPARVNRPPGAGGLSFSTSLFSLLSRSATRRRWRTGRFDCGRTARSCCGRWSGC